MDPSMMAPPVDPNAMPMDPSMAAPAPAPDANAALMALLAAQGAQPQQAPPPPPQPDPSGAIAALTPALTALLSIIDKSYKWGMDRGAEVSAQAQSSQIPTPKAAPALGAVSPQAPPKVQG